MLILLPVVALTLLLAVYKYLTWNYDYWKKRGVPFREGKIPFGNIKDVIFCKKTVDQVYQEIYSQFQGHPVCGFFKLGRPVLMIRSPELIKTVLVKEFNNFHDNDFHINQNSDEILAWNPFVAKGDQWKEFRSILTSAQTPTKIKTMTPHTVCVCRKMIDFLKDHTGTALEMTELMGHFTADIMGAWVLGLEANSFINPETQFRKVSTNMFGGDFKSNLAIQLAMFAPALGNFLGFSTFNTAFLQYFPNLVKGILEERTSHGLVKADIMQMLLDTNKEVQLKGKGRIMDLKEVCGHSVTFFSEGFLTSSLTLSFTLFELAKNPDVQERARKEVFTVISRVDELDYEKVQRFTYLAQIIDETLRLHTTVPLVTRECTKETVLPIGNKELTIEVGTSVTIPSATIHMDPTYYPNPEVFDPERFSEENKHARDKSLFLGFGEGPRICVGMKIAQANMRFGLASLLLHFRVSLTESTSLIEPDPSSSFILLPKNGVWLKFDPL